MASLIFSAAGVELSEYWVRSSMFPVSLRSRAAFLSRMTGAYDSLRVKKVKTEMMPARMAMSQYTQCHEVPRMR